MAQFNAQHSKLITHLRWILEGLILAVALWIFLNVAGRILRQMALAQIVEFSQAKVDAKSIELNLDGSVLIKELVISPYKKISSDDTLLEAETVQARFYLSSLLLLRPRLKELNVDDFTFNTQYNADSGQWNIAGLKIKSPKGSSGPLPTINLKRGTLRFSKVSDRRVKVIATVPVHAEFRAAEKIPGGYSFNVTTEERKKLGKSSLVGFWQPGRIVINGRVISADIPIFERPWTIEALNAELTYNRDLTYSLKLKMKDLVGTEGLSQHLFALDSQMFWSKLALFQVLQDFFDRYHPGGRVDIDFNASGDLRRLGESDITGKVYCNDAFACDRKFDYPIEALNGEIAYTERSVTLNNINGRHGDVRLCFVGWTKDFGPDWKYDIRIISDNMALDEDLYNALSKQQQKFWSSFSPSGMAAIDYRICRRSPTDDEKTLTVELLGVEAVYKGFPYPLKNITGKLFFDSNGVTFSNAVSQDGERKITVNGKVMFSSAGQPAYDISIEVNNIPLDSTLAAALPEEQKRLYNQFSPAGLADGSIKVTPSEKDPNSASYIADLSFQKASLRSDSPALAISDISAKAVFTPDLIRVDHLTGKHAQGLLSLTGQIWPDPNAQQMLYSLTLNGKQAQLNDQLFSLLPKPLQNLVCEFDPAGSINYRADLSKDNRAEGPDYRIIVDCLGNRVNFAHFPYPLTDVTGSLTITQDMVTLKNITAVVADCVRITPSSATMKLNGEINLVDGALSSGSFTASANNIFLDERLSGALPKEIATFYSKLTPTGWFDVDSITVKIAGAEDGEKIIDYNGLFKFKDCNFNTSAILIELNARLNTRGLYKTGNGFQSCQAIFSADSLRIKGKAFTSLKADIYYDPNQKRWFTENLIADCYGGRLTGKFEFAQPTETHLEYLLQASFKQVDLKQFLLDSEAQETHLETPSGTRPPKTRNHSYYSTGKMNGSLSIRAGSHDGLSRIGRCKLAISDMQVGRLSPLAALMHVLKLTEPKDFVFDRMLIDSYIKNDKLILQWLDLSGKALAFTGSGQMDLKTNNVDLILTARGDRLAQLWRAEPSVLQSLAEGIGGAVVRMEVTGNVYEPHIETKALPVIKDTFQILSTPY